MDVAVGSKPTEKTGKEEEKCSWSQMCGACEGERGFDTRTEPGHSPSGAGDPSSNRGDGLSSISLKLQLLFSFLSNLWVYWCIEIKCHYCRMEHAWARLTLVA